MRFLHHDVAPIIAFIETRRLQLFNCDVGHGRTPFVSETNVLDDYLAESEKLWGRGPTHFFFATKSNGPMDLDLRAAVARAEDIVEELVLCAYQDGGIISVTKEMQEFQTTARDASWWQLRTWPRQPKT